METVMNTPKVRTIKGMVELRIPMEEAGAVLVDLSPKEARVLAAQLLRAAVSAAWFLLRGAL